MMSVAQSMLDYKDDVEIERPLQRPEQSIPAAMRKHKAISSKKRKACSVCQLEVTSMNPDLGLAGVKANVSICDTCGCSAHASVQIDSNRRIHQLDMFRGLSCFEIMHTEEGLAIWPMRQRDHLKGPRGCTTSHPVVQELRTFHGQTAKKHQTKPRTDGASTAIGDSTDQETS